MNEQSLFTRLDAIEGQLARIATALELVVAPQPPAPASSACVHPEDQRVDFGMTNGFADWECLACGYRPMLAAMEG